MSLSVKTAELYYTDGRRIVFSKYTIDEEANIKNKKEKVLAKSLNNGGYHMVSLTDGYGKQRAVSVARLMLSTFRGKPPTLKHTADHIESQNKTDNRLENLRWATKSEQIGNQDRPETRKTAFVIVKDGLEKTVKEWLVHFGEKDNPFERAYTAIMISKYAQQKKNGFSYKVFPDLPGEKWKEIPGSPWEMSDKCRVKYITKFAKNILSGDQIGLWNGYPTIGVNGKQQMCHHLSMMLWNPEEWAARGDDDHVLHKDGGRLNFHPENLSIGTRSENARQAYDDGAYDGTLRERIKCVSYIGGVFEKEHDSIRAAARYLRSKEYENASIGNISDVLSGRRKTAYGRTWMKIL